MSEHTNKHGVFVFKIKLNDCTPRVWRRIEVPATHTFFDLHCAIQDAMGWNDSHLHAFRIDTRSQSTSKRKGARGELITIEFPNSEVDDEHSDECYDERKERIADWFGARMTQCVYEYDFGDSWAHTVLFEGQSPSETGVVYPRCTAGKNACPPDDCGGMGGYEHLKKVLKNPKHPDHDDMVDWLCIDNASDFDPAEFSPREVVFQNPKVVLRNYKRGFGV